MNDKLTKLRKQLIMLYWAMTKAAPGSRAYMRALMAAAQVGYDIEIEKANAARG